jgi:hypothetical protein
VKKNKSISLTIQPMSKPIEPPRVSTAKEHQATPHRVDIVLHLGMAGISFQEKIMEIQEKF